MKRYYRKEEEFLDEFQGIGCAAARLLGNEWEPNFHCDDDVRRNQEYLRSSRELSGLVFDGAAVYHDQRGFSSAQIVLKSCDRIVTVAVKNVEGELMAEKVVDKKVDE